MSELNLETSSREQLVEEIKRLRILEAGIVSINELHATPGKMSMELKLNPAFKTYLLYCFAEMLLDAPNYTESKFELAGQVEGEAKWITVTAQKGLGKTPHELRKEAETELASVKETNQELIEYLREAHEFIKKKFEIYAKSLEGLSPDEQFYGEDYSWWIVNTLSSVLKKYDPKKPDSK